MSANFAYCSIMFNANTMRNAPKEEQGVGSNSQARAFWGLLFTFSGGTALTGASALATVWACPARRRVNIWERTPSTACATSPYEEEEALSQNTEDGGLSIGQVLVAKYINYLAESLHRLERWEELELVAIRA